MIRNKTSNEVGQHAGIKNEGVNMLRNRGVNLKQNRGVSMIRNLQRVEWLSPCTVTLRWLKTTRQIEKAEADFMKSHSTVINILKVTDQYYLFSGSVDVNGMKMGLMKDTIWRRPKTSKVVQ